MMNSTTKRIAAGSGLAAIAGAGVWLALSANHRQAEPPKNMVYTSSGYGGFVPKTPPAPTQSASRAAAKPLPVDPLDPIRDAFNAGRYAIVETAAARIVAHAKGSSDLSAHEQSVQASSLMAYAAARRHDLALARDRFKNAQLEASKLPDKGVQTAEPGMAAPTLEEDAAYEHAVCTGALGHAAAAEAEYVSFMRRYPESPLVQASIKRIARLHGGDVPASDQTVWREAGQIAASRQKARQREAAMCGPECLAELLRRRGDAADVHGLATEMGVTDQGSTLEALAAAADKRGYQAAGLSLTLAGLRKQKLPLIALISPGHYVIIDAVSAAQISVWDPDLRGVGHGGAHNYPVSEWTRVWKGVALSLDFRSVMTARS